MSWFWLNMPLAVAFFAIWVGVPMWLILRHPDRGPAPATAQAPAQSPAQALVQARQAASAGPQISDAAQRADQLAAVG